MSTNSNGTESIDWEEILVRLTAYALSWAKGKEGWFRGENTTTFLAGKQAGDYAIAAITKYLENPNKYNPEKGSLFDYLRYGVIWSLVGNDLRSQENITSDDIFARDEDPDDDTDTSPYSERVMPCTAAMFPDDIDYATIRAYIEKEIEGDEDALKILLGVYDHGLKRREIIEEYKMTPAAYDNGMRRLNTVLARAGKFFTEKRPSV